MTNEILHPLGQIAYRHSLKLMVDKNQRKATTVTIHWFRWTILGHIWNHTGEKSVDKGSLSLPKQMNFWKSSEGGRWVISNPKSYVAHFCHYKGVLQSWILGKKSATWFSENEGGGSSAVWNFSENSSVLVGRGFPNVSTYQVLLWSIVRQCLHRDGVIC